MISIASIVEGHGEVQALPVLLRRMSEWISPDVSIAVLTPIRVQRDRFLNREEEFRRQLQLAAAKSGETGWVLILLDADDDCPASFAAGVLQRAQECIPHRRVSVVLAKREYEAWFIAAARSLDGARGFRWRENDEVDAELPRDAKGWMGHRMGAGGYREVIDQPAFTARFDLQQAFNRSRSFRKLSKEWRLHVQGND